ncbi:MAG: hypothetical protein WC915_00090 [archaeon]|jgi:hypothetical protein
MQKKIRPQKLQYEWNQSIKTHKLNNGKVTLIKKYIRTEGLQKGRFRNLTTRSAYLHKQLKTLQDFHINAGTHLTQKEQTTIQNQAFTMFRDIELFMRSETVFQEGRKDTKIESRSSERMHTVSSTYMSLSLALINLEKAKLVEKGFKNKCIPETVLDYLNLERENQAHHNSIVNKIGNERKIQEGFRKRRNHFEKLKEDPLFSKLLSKTQKIKTGYGDHQINFELILTGAKEVPIMINENPYRLEKMHVSLLLDHLGRVRFFAKPMSNKNNTWIELRGLSTKQNTSKYLIAKEVTHWNVKDSIEQKAYSQVLQKTEEEIKFDPEITQKDILKIQKFM